MFSGGQKLYLNRYQRYMLLTASLWFLLTVHSDIFAAPAQDKNYLLLEHNMSSDKSDLDVSSIGMLSLKDNKAGYAKLSYLESDSDGKATTLDLGGGVAVNSDISFFLMLGVALGYNWDKDDTIAAYFPEVGIVLDITQRFGLTVSGKRYFNLYEDDEDVIMLGLVFRN